MLRAGLSCVLVLFTAELTLAGPFPAAGIPAGDPAITAWATVVTELVRGPRNIAVPGPLASFGVGANALGHANAGSNVVSLGDGGHITVYFARSIINGPGADFAVFENGFVFGGAVFAELGFVEVSTDGTTFVRFPSTSLTQTPMQVTNADGLDPTNIHNLAGQFPALQGTPFDLDDVGLSYANYVRIVDVVGSINPSFGTHDSLGNLINDPYTTAFSSGGFDLDAVGVIHEAPAPSSLLLMLVGAVTLAVRRRRERNP